MVSLFTKRPFLTTAIFGCISLLICYKIKIFSLLFSAVLLILLLVLFLKRKSVRLFLTILFALLIVVNTLFTFQKISKINSLNGEPFTARFVAIEDCESFNYYSTVTVKSDDEALPKNTKLFLKYDSSNYISGGDVFWATVTLNGLEDSDNKSYNYGNSVFVGSVAEDIVFCEGKSKFYIFTANIRSYIKDTMLKFFEGDIGAILLALTTGDKSCLSSELSFNVKATGISHIIVVSGLHLAIIMSGAFKFIDIIFNNKFFKSAVCVLLVFLVVSVCGFSMSVIRAGIMYVIAALSPLFDRENDSLNSLGATVTAVLIATPFAVLNISFQLSVLATLAIIWVTPFYYNLLIDKLNISFGFYKVVLNIFLASLFATIFTMPIVIYDFGTISAIAPLTNLLITYPVSWSLSFNILGLILHSIPLISPISWLPFTVSGLCTKYNIFIINSLANLPITLVNLERGAIYFSLLLIALIIGFMLVFNNFLKRKEECQDGCDF